MNKTELIQAVNSKLDTKYGSKVERAADFVNTVLEVIEERMARGEGVKLQGFCNFEVESRKARTVRNPQTGDPMAIPACKTVVIRPSKALKAKVNGS